MTIKTILVSLSGADTGRSPLTAAFHVAQLFDAHVEVLHVRPDPRTMIPYVGEGMSGALIEEVMTAADRESVERASGARQLFDQLVGQYAIPISAAPVGTGMSAAWHEDAGREDEAVARFGRTNDMVVVSRPLREAEVATSAVFEAALFDCGQPLLVAPPQPASGFGRSIMIAWNGSPEAARAVTAALPFLHRAERVKIATVHGWSEGPTNIAALATRLAWHGIAAEVETVGTHSGTIGETVLAKAAQFGADMIVMGAYTQSRLRQMILGGVTRHVLSTATVPLVMAH